MRRSLPHINPKYGGESGRMFYTHLSDQYAPSNGSDPEESGRFPQQWRERGGDGLILATAATAVALSGKPPCPFVQWTCCPAGVMMGVRPSGRSVGQWGDPLMQGCSLLADTLKAPPYEGGDLEGVCQ